MELSDQVHEPTSHHRVALALLIANYMGDRESAGRILEAMGPEDLVSFVMLADRLLREMCQAAQIDPSEYLLALSQWVEGELPEESE